MSKQVCRNEIWRAIWLFGVVSLGLGMSEPAEAIECVPNAGQPVCFSESGFAAVTWEAASGDVAYYEIFMARDGGAFSSASTTDGNETQAVLADDPNHVFQIRVRACAATQNCGDLSEPSDGIQFQAAPARFASTTDPDFDGDGYPDLIWTNLTSGALVLWSMHQGVSAELGTIEHNLGAGWKPLAHVDFNGDGYADLFWRNDSTGENRIHLMQSTTVIGTLSIPSQPAGWVLGSAGDYNGDGDTDLFWRHATTGANLLWYLQQNRLLGTKALSTLKNSVWANRATSADLNGDGHCDLILQQNKKALAMAIVMKPSGFAGYLFAGRPANSWQLVSAHDVTRDGNPELIWSSSSGEMEAWSIAVQTSASFAKILARKTLPSYGGTTTIRSVGDYDGDGLLELVLGDATTGVHSLYQLTATADAAGAVTITDAANPAWSVLRLQ